MTRLPVVLLFVGPLLLGACAGTNFPADSRWSGRSASGAPPETSGTEPTEAVMPVPQEVVVGDEAVEEVTTIATAAAPKPKPAARTVEDFDTTSAAQRAAAQTEVKTASERKLGTTIASLGDPTDPGFWIKTSLVSQPAKGKLVNPANGETVNVNLIPLGGSGGAQVSLPAMRQLGVSLTDLPEIEVWRL